MKIPTKKELQQQLATATRHNQALTVAVQALGTFAQALPCVVHPHYSSTAGEALIKIAKLIKPRK